MKNNRRILSAARIQRLRAQGYINFSDGDLTRLSFGNRFAFILCGTLLLISIVTANIPALIMMMMVAFLGVVLPYHPFDYIYDHIVRKIVKQPAIPPRSKQLKFACGIATLWIAGVIYLFYSGSTMAGYITGGILFTVAFLVSVFDYCIPSVLYNAIFKIKISLKSND